LERDIDQDSDYPIMSDDEMASLSATQYLYTGKYFEHSQLYNRNIML